MASQPCRQEGCRVEQEVRKRLRRRKCRVSDWLHRGEGSSILVCEEIVPFSLLGNMGSMAEVTGGRRARVEPMMILYMLTLRLRLKENIEKNLFSEIRKSKEEN